MRIRFLFCLPVLVLVAAAFASSAAANHSWGSYHWARTANPFTVQFGDNVTSNWDPILGTASGDWTQSSVLDTPVVAGRSKGNCRPTSGRVEVCNGNYGYNGWLGLAQIWASGSHITQGTTKMNDTYLSSSRYTTTNKQHVMCQEVGHTLGLDHQDESGADLNTCMDYSNALDNPHPNAHDYQQLETIYTHLDTTNSSYGPASAGSGHGLQLGRSLFVEDLGNGHKLFTFVFWASPFDGPLG
jgi:hypothetical protein